MTVLTWSQFGLAGLIAVTLGGVVAYVFRLFVRNQEDVTHRLVIERDDALNENIRLHNKIEDQQQLVLGTLSDVSRVMAQVQQVMREREIQQALEKELERRKRLGDGT